LEQLLGIIATILLYCAACCIACYRTIMMTVRILLITESCLICPHQGNPTAQVAPTCTANRQMKHLLRWNLLKDLRPVS
jgi:hypothetical protein